MKGYPSNLQKDISNTKYNTLLYPHSANLADRSVTRIHKVLSVFIKSKLLLTCFLLNYSPTMKTFLAFNEISLVKINQAV